MKALESSLKKLGIKKIGSEEMGCTEYSLANGLKVLLVPNHSAPVVTFMQLFRVGSRDEGVGHTGATHFLEHMMFKGTKKFDPQKGLDSTELLNRIGAVSNATTWFDRTNYFEAVPSEYLEFCIKIEADRMRNLRLRESDRNAEMSVVRNELERGENSPDEAMEKEMYAIAYREHPYHHPTIGWRSDVEQVPMERLKEFYDVFYWPNNCTVVIVGDFDVEQALKLLHKYYGKITKSPRPIPQVYTVEPPQEGERRYQISRSGDLPRVWVGHRTPASSHADHYPLNVISHLLGGSHDRGSRLYKALIDSGLAMDVACRHDELRDPALLIVAATLTPEADPSLVEKEILKELERLIHEDVSEAELAPIKSANRKGSILARADQMELAFAIGEAEARADWRWLSNFDRHFEAVDGADIKRVAAEYFQKDNRTVGIFVPSEAACEDESDEEEQEEEFAAKSNGKSAKAAKLSAAELEKILVPAKKGQRASFSSQVKQKELANGLTLLHMENPGTGSVAVTLNIPAGNYFEPEHKHGVADVVVEMLMRGSEDLNKVELAQALKEMGLLDGMNFHADGFALHGGATVVKEDLPRYFQLLSQVLRKPVFLEDELSKLQLEWAARIAEQKNNTGPVALNRLYKELYPAGHIFHQIDFDQQVAELKELKRSDLLEFHKVYSPARAIITVVGDIAWDNTLELVAENFSDWTGIEPAQVKVDSVPVPAKSRRLEIRMPDKASMDILMGHPLPVKRSDPEYYPLYIANLALGGDTIIARLGKLIREQHGLTYGIYSSLGDNSHGAAPWTVSLSVNPLNANKALGLVSDVLEKYKKSGITADELRREAGGAAGLFTVSMRSSLAIARILTRFQALGLGVEGADLHSKRILAVKKSEVDEVIRKYLHPEKMLTVLAGSF
ncbi:MAG: insulinase family protein [Candidatus Obscuribacterales bacterium]|nr:insulinase family protein [Candidatus Obscuribacterales bacterium]